MTRNIKLCAIDQLRSCGGNVTPVLIREALKEHDEIVANKSHAILYASTAKEVHQIVKGIMFSELMHYGLDDHPVEAREIGEHVSKILSVLERIDPSLEFNPLKEDE